MATERGRAVDSVAAKGVHVNDGASPAVPLCVACGRYHGSVGAEMNCLRAEVVHLRAEIRSLVGLPTPKVG